MNVNKTLRHMRATHTSDFEFLRQSLREAAGRFSDLADIIEKDHAAAVTQIGFMRASAKRYKRSAELDD